MLASAYIPFSEHVYFDVNLFYSFKQINCLKQSPLLLTQTTMAILNILHYPDDKLYTIAKPVTVFDARLEQFVRDMGETMYAAPGIGLAATQVNVHQRVVVIDISEEKNSLMALINPEIIAMNGKTMWEEGCLSVPGIYEEVERAEQVTVRAFDATGQVFELAADGLLAICIQHELDHLDGKVFVEKLSKLKQNRILQKLKKNQRKTM